MAGTEDVNAKGKRIHFSRDAHNCTHEVEIREFDGLNFRDDVQGQMKQLETEAKDVADRMFNLETRKALFLDSAKKRGDGQGSRIACRQQLKGQECEFKSKMVDLESQAKDLEQRLVKVLSQKAPIQAPKNDETVMELTRTIKNFEQRVVEFEAEASFAQKQLTDAMRSKEMGEKRMMELQLRYSLLEQAHSQAGKDEMEALQWKERLEENEASTATLVHQLNAEFRQYELKNAQECQVFRRQLAERDLKLTERDAALRNSISRDQFDLIQMRHDNLESTVYLTDRKCVGMEEEFAKMKLLLDLEVARTSTAEDALQAQKTRAEMMDRSLQRMESSSGALHAEMKDESVTYFKTRAETAERALAELQVRLQEQAEAARISTEALEARQQKHLALEASEAKAQDTIARLGARLKESIRAEETAEAKVSSLVQSEAVALLDAKTCQQVELETELQAEASKTQGTKQLLQKYEDDVNEKSRESSELREMVQKLGANASMMEAMTTNLEAEKEELFAEREELNVQLSMLKKKVVALTLQEKEPPQQVLYQQQAAMPLIRSVSPRVLQSPVVSPLTTQGQTMYVRSPPTTPPVQTRSLMQSARVMHVSEVARNKPVDTNLSMTMTSLPAQFQGESVTLSPPSPVFKMTAQRSFQGNAVVAGNQSSNNIANVAQGSPVPHSSPVGKTWYDSAPVVASPAMDTNRNLNFISPNGVMPKIDSIQSTNILSSGGVAQKTDSNKSTNFLSSGGISQKTDSNKSTNFLSSGGISQKTDSNKSTNFLSDGGISQVIDTKKNIPLPLSSSVREGIVRSPFPAIMNIHTSNGDSESAVNPLIRSSKLLSNGVITQQAYSPYRTQRPPDQARVTHEPFQLWQSYGPQTQPSLTRQAA